MRLAGKKVNTCTLTLSDGCKQEITIRMLPDMSTFRVYFGEDHGDYIDSKSVDELRTKALEFYNKNRTLDWKPVIQLQYCGGYPNVIGMATRSDGKTVACSASLMDTGEVRLHTEPGRPINLFWGGGNLVPFTRERMEKLNKLFRLRQLLDNRMREIVTAKDGKYELDDVQLPEKFL